jgi:hypothetical protein
VCGKNRSISQAGRTFRLGKNVFSVVSAMKPTSGFHYRGPGIQNLAEATPEGLRVDRPLSENLTEPARFAQEFFKDCVAVWRFLRHQGGEVEVDYFAEPQEEVARFEERSFQALRFKLGDAPDKQEAVGV